MLGALLALLAACGDSSGDVSQGGAGGDGGSSGVTNPTTGTQAGGAGGEAPEFPVCTLAEAEDQTALPAITIISVGTAYQPRCVRVSAGTEVTFESDFESHPLHGGEIVDEVGVLDPASPITPTEVGSTATFTLADAGDVPYFCDFHSSIGMHGTIFVE